MIISLKYVSKIILFKMCKFFLFLAVFFYVNTLSAIAYIDPKDNKTLNYNNDYYNYYATVNLYIADDIFLKKLSLLKKTNIDILILLAVGDNLENFDFATSKITVLEDYLKNSSINYNINYIGLINKEIKEFSFLIYIKR